MIAQVRKQNPAWWSWTIVGVVSIFSFFIFSLFSNIWLKSELQNWALRAYDLIYQQYLQHYELNVANTEGLKVVAMGTSAMEAATECHDFFQEKAQESGLSLKLFKLIYYGENNLERLTLDKKLWDRLLLNPPDLLLIESKVVTYKFLEELYITQSYDVAKGIIVEASLPEKWKIKKTKFRHQNRRLLKYIKPFKSPLPFVEERKFQSCSDGSGTHFQGDSLFFPLAKRVIRKWEENEFFHPYLKKLQEAGIPIVFLRLPMPGIKEEILLSGKNGEDYQIMLNSYKKQFGIEFWKYPKSMPFENYQNYGNMNEIGRRQYSIWLHKELVQYFEQNQHDLTE